MFSLQHFTRSLRPRDWDAFRTYSPLVRSLSFKEGKDVNTSTFFALTIQRPVDLMYSPYLPNLHTLRWLADSAHVLTCCLPFISPSLRNVEVHAVGSSTPVPERSDATGGFLCNLAQMAPRLKEVRLVIERLWMVQDIVTPLNMLEEMEVLVLDTGSITPFILRGLSCHASLRRLEVDLCGIDESFLPQLAQNPSLGGEYVALKEVKIAGDMHIVDMMLSVVICAPLERLSISTFGLTSKHNMTRCFNTVASTCPSLRALVLTSTIRADYDHCVNILTMEWEEYTVGMDVFGPLLPLKSLEEVEVFLGYPLYVDDLGLERLLVAWPQIRNLQLSPLPEWTPCIWAPPMTLKGLEMVARLGKRIESLGVLVEGTNTLVKEVREFALRDISPAPPTPPLTPDVSTLPSSQGSNGSSTMFSRSELRFLTVGPSLLNRDEETVSLWLAELFPLLTSIMCTPTATGSSGDWKRVEEHLAVLRGEGRSQAPMKEENDGSDGIPSGLFEEEMEVDGDDDSYEWRLTDDEGFAD
jgi:hypothetical protein